MELNTGFGFLSGVSTGTAASVALILLSQYLSFIRIPSAIEKREFVLNRTIQGASFLWLFLICRFVPEPYLDEVFHIPQAQKYCEGKFREWDDKITTPPGLYIITVLAQKVFNFFSRRGPIVCDMFDLRMVNFLSLGVLNALASNCRHQIEARLHEKHSATKLGIHSLYASHTAFNIGLFPLVFFFSGLYYTDVMSTTVVIGALQIHLTRLGQERSSLLSDGLTIFLGLFSLFMRQTNIFWVVVYMGGVEAVHAVKTLWPERVDQPFMTTLSAQLRFYAWRYSVGDVHDVPLHDAWPEDILFSIISLVIAAICNPLRVLRQVWPHITVLAVFSAFVSWNGGVVLGDKSNHVATIHFAQMLYIWPLFAFFSLPLFLPYALPVINLLVSAANVLLSALGFNLSQTRQHISSTGITEPASPSTSSSQGTGSSQKGRARNSKQHSANRDASSTETGPSQEGRAGNKKNQPASTDTYSTRHSQLSPVLRWVWMLLESKLVLWPLYLLATVIISVAIVKFNTIIHPFTLADNRHYMFYVFRYTLRRATWIRYLLIIPYTISRWMIWGTMAGCSTWLIFGGDPACSAYYSRSNDTPFRSNPFWIDLTDIKQQPRGAYLGPPQPQTAVEKLEMENRYASDPLAFSVEPVPTSTALVFLLATTLSLVTAPLVEPRYFIIPWVIWRLLVPAWRAHDHEPSTLITSLSRNPRTSELVHFFQRYDLRLILETVWFIIINLVTGYIFLLKPYQWRAEDGTLLDEGRLQRFMW